MRGQISTGGDSERLFLSLCQCKQEDKEKDYTTHGMRGRQRHDTTKQTNVEASKAQRPRERASLIAKRGLFYSFVCNACQTKSEGEVGFGEHDRYEKNCINDSILKCFHRVLDMKSYYDGSTLDI